MRRLVCRLLNAFLDSSRPSLALKADAHRDLVAFSDMPFPELVRPERPAECLSSACSCHPVQAEQRVAGEF